MCFIPELFRTYQEIEGQNVTLYPVEEWSKYIKLVPETKIIHDTVRYLLIYLFVTYHEKRSTEQNKNVTYYFPL